MQLCNMNILSDISNALMMVLTKIAKFLRTNSIKLKSLHIVCNFFLGGGGGGGWVLFLEIEHTVRNKD